MSHFSTLERLPEDPILSLPIDFAAETRKQKVNLGVGSYHNAQGKSVVLNCVRRAEHIIFEKHLSKEYAPIEGPADYIADTLKLILGEPLYTKCKARIVAAQAIGGTGALCIAGDFLKRNGSPTLYLPDLTWPNHTLIFEYAGLPLATYPYYQPQLRKLDFEGLRRSIQEMKPGSVMLLHGSCHNPTGIDPTPVQWKEIAALLKEHRIIPLIDVAYQGFGDSMEADTHSVHLFAEEGQEFFITYSFSKNLGLYGERAGLFAMVLPDPVHVPTLSSHIKRIIRSSYSNPPIHPARIVTTILESPDLYKEWMSELSVMRDRLNEMRHAFSSGLEAVNISNLAEMVRKQRGVFSFIGLTPQHVYQLRQEYAIYMPSNGRINIAGFNWDNIDYVVNALSKVLN